MFFVNNCLFVLGAPDPEMAEIEAILEDAGVPFIYAEADGKRVHPGNAYRASAPDISGYASVARVECAWEGMAESIVAMDHHRLGDPGYGTHPAQYWRASSIGQVCAVLGVSPTPHLFIVAAADHCLPAAYRGECPGVTSRDLGQWRAESRATFQKRSVAEVMADVENAARVLRAAPKQLYAGVEVATLQDGSPNEAPEAACREGIPFQAIITERGGRRKWVLQAAPEAVVEKWLASCGLADPYGDPARGFAGGYID